MQKHIYLDNPALSGRLKTHKPQPTAVDELRRPRGILPTKAALQDSWVDVWQATVPKATPKAEPEPAVSPATLTPELVAKPINYAPPAIEKINNHRHYRLFNTLAAILVLLGLGIGIHTYLTNKQAINTVQTAEASQSSAPAGQSDPLLAYTVAPDMPRFLRIPKIDVYSRVKPVGLDASNQIQAPGSVGDTGWFNKSAKPGEAAATASLLDGHISGWTEKGVFHRLHELTAGDNLSIEKGDGSVLNYRVVDIKEYNKDAVDMGAALSTIEPGKQGLNIMTCIGKVTGDSYEKRLVVYAVQT